MKHIRSQFADLKRSFFNPSFYTRVQKRKLSSGIWFVFFLNLFVGIFVTGFLLFQILPEFITFSKSDPIQDMYPDELVITIKDGVASTNAQEPLYIPMKTEGEEIKQLVVIDTTHDLTLEDIAEYRAAMVLTKDSIVGTKSDGEMRVYSLKDVKDFTMDKEKARKWTDMAFSWGFILIAPLAILMVFSIAAFSLLYYAVVLLIAACIPLIVAKVRQRKITYAEAYVISLYAIGPVIVADTVAMIFGIASLPLWVTAIIFTAIILINLTKEAPVVVETPAAS